MIARAAKTGSFFFFGDPLTKKESNMEHCWNILWEHAFLGAPPPRSSCGAWPLGSKRRVAARLGNASWRAPSNSNNNSTVLGVGKLPSPLQDRSLRSVVDSSNKARLPNKKSGRRKTFQLFMDDVLDLVVSSRHNNSSSSPTDDDDDDTCTTLSFTSSSSSSSSVEELVAATTTTTRRTRRVSWSNELQVYERPPTTEKQKYHLYYNEFDYLEFRMDAMTAGRRPARDRTVRFAVEEDDSTREQEPSIVGTNYDTSLVPKETLYYTQTELQRFLDEFVASLRQPAHVMSS